jgi:hypothetical protein
MGSLGAVPLQMTACSAWLKRPFLRKWHIQCVVETGCTLGWVPGELGLETLIGSVIWLMHCLTGTYM